MFLRSISVRRLSLRARTMLVATIGLIAIFLLDGSARQHAMRDLGRAGLTERAGLLTSLEAAALSVPLWNLDQDQLDAALDAMAADPDFASASLLKQDGSTMVQRVRAGRAGTTHLIATIEAAQPIHYTDHGEIRTLGTLHLALATTRLEQALRHQLFVQAASVLLLLGAVLLAVWSALRQLIRPLDLLTSALGRLAQGDLETPLPALDRTDEVGDVARALQVFRDTANRLVMAEAQYRTLFDHAALGIFGADEQGRITSVNKALLGVTGFSDRERAAAALGDESLFVRPGRRDELTLLIRRDGGYAGQSSEFRRPDGTTCWVSQTVRSFKDESGRVLGYTGTVEDITDSRRLQSQERLRVHAAMQSTSDAILIAGEDGEALFTNPAYAAIFGSHVAETELAGGLPARMADATAARALLRALRTGEAWQSEADIGIDDGAALPMLIRASAILDDLGGRVGTVVICTDLTQQRAAEARIRHMAHHDALTGLSNRVLFGDRLDAALATLRTAPDNKDGGVALLCLDLDRFKEVNDLFGHTTGDGLLRAVARRLAEMVRPGDLVARLGGDEFIVLQAAPVRQDTAEALAKRLIARISEPYSIDGRAVCIGVSVGIVLAPLHAMDAGQLMRFGDMALYDAKTQGRGRAQLFTPELGRTLRLRTEMERDLRLAVAEEALHLHYQPQYTLADGRLCGAEALLRWQDPARGAVSPAEFVPIAEECGLITALGAWVLRAACKEAAGWPNKLSVAVNLSPVQFRTSDVLALVSSILQETGLEPDRLELEITEGVLLGDDDPTLATLAGLKALGVHIAMDDFGTGYSSLSYLSRMPIDKLKIDQSFTRALGHDAAALPLVRSIIAIARDLGIVSLVEGVETEAQAQIMRNEGCVEVQGYLFGRPISADAFAALAAQPPDQEALARVA